jgi:broad specificity phosphatase PhoE
VQFPLAANKPLFNSYTFVRVGTTLLEEEDIWSTNPLFLTNRDDALSPDGQAQIQQACETLVATVKPTTVIYSLAAASMDAANIIQQELQMGRDRIRAEFTFMDPRAIGQYDLLTASTTQPAVWALDADEAGPEGRGGRPPPNEDGTPHETLADQAIRLRQLFSVLESQYSGENIVLVFPDGTGPALLCAMMAGLALNQVHRLEFQPGQVRANVTPALIRQWYAESLEPTADAVYQKRLKLGRQRLAELRGQEEFVNRKDEKLEEERLDYERELAVQQAQVQLEKDKEEEQRQERKAEVEAQRAQVETQRVEARARSAPSVGTGSSPWSISPAVLGGGAFATTLVLSQLRPREDGLERIAQSHARADVTGSTNATSTTTNTTTTLYNNVGSQRAADANATREATATSSPPPPTNTPTTRTTSSLYGAPEDPMSRLLLNTNDEASREMAAAQAMQEYLEQDDGGDDWLISLLQMLEEEEDVAPAEEEEPKDHHVS